MNRPVRNNKAKTVALRRASMLLIQVYIIKDIRGTFSSVGSVSRNRLHPHSDQECQCACSMKETHVTLPFMAIHDKYAAFNF